MKRIDHSISEEIYIFTCDGVVLLEVVNICTSPCVGEIVGIDCIEYTVEKIIIDPVAIKTTCELSKQCL